MAFGPSSSAIPSSLGTAHARESPARRRRPGRPQLPRPPSGSYARSLCAVRRHSGTLAHPRSLLLGARDRYRNDERRWRIRVVALPRIERIPQRLNISPVFDDQQRPFERLARVPVLDLHVFSLAPRRSGVIPEHWGRRGSRAQSATASASTRGAGRGSPIRKTRD